MNMENAILERSQRSAQELWAIEDLYASDELWYRDLAAFKAAVEELKGYAGHLGESAATLLAFMEKSEALGVLLDSISNYAHRKHDEDTRISTYQAMTDQLTAAWVEAGAALAFETPELLAIPEEQMEGFYSQECKLEHYRRYITKIRRQKDHILSDKEERLLAAAGEMAGAPDTIYSMLCDADLQFPDAVDGDGKKHPMSQGMYISYMQSEDRVLRKSAFESLYHVFGDHKNTLAATLSAQVKQLQFYASARRYPSALAASLDQNEVPEAVYHSLIDTVHRHLGTMGRYMRLRKKLLGVDELHMYDIYTPLIPGVEVHIPYDEAKDTVATALAPLGEDYLAILREGFQNRWIDVYENPGKRSGAYSAGARVHPYVLLNYTDNTESLFTLAHEMGHAIHSYLSNRTQRPVDADYVIFVAEVASTCNEALLMQHLLSKQQDKKQRAWLINYFLEQFRTTLYRQTMFAEFELLLGSLNASGEALTAQRLGEEYRKLNALYYGDGVVLDEEIDLEWARIPHFYYNYYVYQYATGYAAAIALSRRILKEGEAAVKDYLAFLSSGCSQDPISLLKLAGVDLSTPEPVEQALCLFDELLTELEALCGEEEQ
ncbi:MAG: oligoendopeptidase F [Ruminococcaceae bacterium]|nr:oligoendopeptidase F [Oscillospiraceae bacterium]